TRQARRVKPREASRPPEFWTSLPACGTMPPPARPPLAAVARGDVMRHPLPFALLALLSFAPGVLAAEKPNILFIYADDQSYKTVGCYPESWPWVKTPNTDALAKSGVRFRGAYLGGWCMPSRASILTGRHPHGV